jgi:hypothetical protein
VGRGHLKDRLHGTEKIIIKKTKTEVCAEACMNVWRAADMGLS